MTDHLLLPAAGVGRRFGHDRPKQYCTLADRTLMEWTLDLWLNVRLDGRRLLILAQSDSQGRDIARSYSNLDVAVGGEERADSVLAGLEALNAQEQDWVLVHDIARPCVRVEDIERLLDHCHRTGRGGLLATPVSDTIKRRDGDAVSTIDRRQLWSALTPQCFRFGELKQALASALSAGVTITDEASAMERAGFPVDLVEGARDNLKLTRPEDRALIEFYLMQQGRLEQR
ncbi:2-C-methyl-D-erythritol 4-phosphate cytidylyltransferase [Saccharospirillum salsuginis]|uniref:2-C-methyl-D-erythritol 4-phosphate cytidylyltransferase n=1 Tax=Saccharospirillum salsuginis TaxID=418750 RepID=A0A918NEM2_9GAMM|nr:2-C-methyl-D-erythritol 4-phosphate cytidylyltransferase [Saccharospirillum salsuginis]GGX61681.1 2-C-methyl-D-erythritol 4-phosphate cytidylyltransferase [Saccharospirillum salsuginis]